MESKEVEKIILEMTEHYLTEDFLDLVIQNGRAFRIMQNRRFQKTKGPINIALVKREL